MSAHTPEADIDRGGFLTSLKWRVTHHHAVRHDHRPWYDRLHLDAFAAALGAAKGALDPDGIMNPRVLVDMD